MRWWILEYLASEKFVLVSESNLPPATGLASSKVSLEPCIIYYKGMIPVECWLIPSIDPWSALDWHLNGQLIDVSIDTWLTLGWQFINISIGTWLMVSWMLTHSHACIDRHWMACVQNLVGSQSIVDHCVNQVLIKCHPMCWLSID